VKKVAITLAVLIALVGVGLYWLSHNINGLVKNSIEDYGSAMTQAKVKVGAVQIAAKDGRGSISHLLIGNPAGFKTPMAMKFGRLDIDVDLASVTRDVIHVRRIAIIAPDIIYEKGDSQTNFDAIQKNIDAYLGADAPKTEKKSGKKLIVDELTLRDAKVEVSAALMNGKTVTVPLPDITLRDIGRTQGGVTPGELGQQVAGAIKARLTGAVSLDHLMKSTGDAISKTGTAIKKLFK
jgi:hypothetical protein